MIDKTIILNAYLQLVQDKIDVYLDLINSLMLDSQNDAKSSAGDKHETALSMMHLEQEKLTAKLNEAIANKKALNALNVSLKQKNIGLGSLVFTNKVIVFIAVALPKITIENTTIFGISPQSPLGKMLVGNSEKHTFLLNNVEYSIDKVL